MTDAAGHGAKRAASAVAWRLTASNDTTIRIPVGGLAVSGRKVGRFVDDQGVVTDCAHDHANEAEAQACAEAMRDAWVREHPERARRALAALARSVRRAKRFDRQAEACSPPTTRPRAGAP